MLEKDGMGGKCVCKKRGLIISEVASENAQMLAFVLKTLTMVRSHKEQSKELIHIRRVVMVGVVTVRRAISLTKPEAFSRAGDHYNYSSSQIN